MINETLLYFAFNSACVTNDNVTSAPRYRVTYNRTSNSTNWEVFFADNPYDSFDVEYSHTNNEIYISGNWFNASVQTIKNPSKLSHESLVKRFTANINTMFIRAVEHA
jgi:hypothetical protein